MIAYMIMCHKNRKQVNRLLAALKSNNSVCFVHIDINADFQPSEIQGGIITENRYHGILGDYSLVQIADELILTARKHEKKYNVKFKYFCLLSGQDYLVVPVEKINEQLEASYPKPFIDCTPWSTKNWIYHGANSNIFFYKKVKELGKKFPRKSILGKVLKYPFILGNRFFRRISNVQSVLKNNGVNLYGGSAWWILPDDMVEYLIEQKQRFGKSSRFYPLKYVLVPEENYYQTMLMNSEFGNRIEVNPPEMVEQNCKTYAWFSPEGKEFTGHPYIFTISDVNVLKGLSNSRFFARKFDENVDSDVLDWIDNNLLCHKYKDEKWEQKNVRIF